MTRVLLGLEEKSCLVYEGGVRRGEDVGGVKVGVQQWVRASDQGTSQV